MKGSVTVIVSLAMLCGFTAPAFAQPASAPGAILFVANKAEGSVSRIRLADGREELRGPACKTPHELALAPDGRHIAVGCYDGETIAILSSHDLSPARIIQLDKGARPHGLIWHPNGAIYATAEGLSALYRIDHPMAADPAITRFPTGQAGSHMLVVDKSATTAWTANLAAGSVTRIDLSGKSAALTAATGAGTEGLALSSDGTSLWVSARQTRMLSELDPGTLTLRRSVKVGAVPLRAAVSPDGKHVVTSNFGDGTVSVVSAASGEVMRTLRVLGDPQGQQVTLLFSPDGARLYAAETGLSKIAEIDFASGKVLGRLGGGVGGDGLAILDADAR